MSTNWLGRLVQSWRDRRGNASPETGMDEEVRFHLDMATQRNVERGMRASDARRTALAAFGGVVQTQEAARDDVPGRWADALRQDLRYSLRTLRRNPGFSASVVLTLALGVGATTAIFSVVNGVLLRPLPVPDPEQLVFVGWEWTPGNYSQSLSGFKLGYLRSRTRTLGSLTTYRGFERELGEPPAARRVRGQDVSSGFFETVGIQPSVGRGFTPDEFVRGGPRVAVISDAIWRTEFAGDPSVIGREIRLDGVAHMVVGITPPTFRLPALAPEYAEVLVPIYVDATPGNKSNDWVSLARTRPGYTREQVRADLESAARTLQAEYPQVANAGEQYRLYEFRDLYVGPLERKLYILLGAVGFVLLIAVTNAANLMLGRAAAREREMVVRRALGAKRSRVVRQLICEGAVLSVLSGILGLALGVWGMRIMLALTPQQLPRADEIGLDYRVLAFTTSIVVVTGLLFGLAAALPTGRVNLASVLGERARGAGGSRRSRDVLVLSETAFAIILLAGAGLLLASFAKLRAVDPGFRQDNVTAVRFDRMPLGYETMDAVWRFERDFVDRVSKVPGVRSVAGLSNFPLERGWNMPVAVTGQPESGRGDVEYRWVTPGYFETLRIPMVRGRQFTSADGRAAPRVAMLNAAMAKQFFPDANPVGQRIDIGRYKGEWISKDFEGSVEIVGVVGDLREVGLAQEPKKTVYIPVAQAQDRLATLPPLFVIHGPTPASLRTAVEHAARDIDPRVQSPRLDELSRIVSASISEQRFQATLLATFAAAALALTAIGIFGVVAYGVQQRVREIGVRVALGATSGDVLRLIVGRSLAFVAAGIAVGVLGALGLTRFLSTFLFGVTTTDPMTFAVAISTLFGVAFAASYLPARRATRIDPVRALRLE
jgi:putative ABC transport system permease protein